MAPCRIRTGLLGMLLILGAIALGGCSHERALMERTIELGFPLQQPVEVVVRNFHGTVEVIAEDRDETIEVEVTGFGAPAVGNEQRRFASREVDAAVSFDKSDGWNRVIVETTSGWDEVDQTHAHVIVRAPRLNHVRIENRGGQVLTSGVEGLLNIQSLDSTVARGSIIVRTDRPMTAPVTLVSGSGSIMYQVGPDSSGRFELTGDGRPGEIFSPAARFKDIASGGGFMRATLNSADNPVLLRSESGRVRAYVLESPEGYFNDFR